MSKTFDTADQQKLMSILGSILTKCELHIMHVLISEVILNVKIGNKTGPDIFKNIRICQGDCLSALSPVYPSCILPFHLNRYHLSSLLLVITSLSCEPLTRSSIVVYKIIIDPKFADEIWFLGSDESKINQVEREIRGLQQACM